MYVTTFKVTGKGCFPFDMLRRDTCYPTTERDSELMAERSSPTQRRMSPRSVCLVRTGSSPYWQPTFGRWESFGWEVEEVETYHA